MKNLLLLIIGIVFISCQKEGIENVYEIQKNNITIQQNYVKYSPEVSAIVIEVGDISTRHEFYSTINYSTGEPYRVDWEINKLRDKVEYTVFHPEFSPNILFTVIAHDNGDVDIIDRYNYTDEKFDKFVKTYIVYYKNGYYFDSETILTER